MRVQTEVAQEVEQFLGCRQLDLLLDCSTTGIGSSDVMKAGSGVSLFCFGMNAFGVSKNVLGFIVFRSSQPRENGMENPVRAIQLYGGKSIRDFVSQAKSTA